MNDNEPVVILYIQAIKRNIIMLLVVFSQVEYFFL